MVEWVTRTTTSPGSSRSSEKSVNPASVLPSRSRMRNALNVSMAGTLYARGPHLPTAGAALPEAHAILRTHRPGVPIGAPGSARKAPLEAGKHLRSAGNAGHRQPRHAVLDPELAHHRGRQVAV